jgi:V8-like Glu-specific endopeptidase
MGQLVPPTEILFKLGLQGSGRYVWRSTVKRFEVHPEYLKNEDESHDFAVLKLSENIGLKAGWATLGIVEDFELRGMMVNISGYPGQKGFWDILSQKATYDMYTMKGPIAKVTGGKIYYEIDTSGGQSGSGIWVFDKDQKPICIGVHTTGSKLLGNGGVRITKDNSELIQEWMKTMEKD